MCKTATKKCEALWKKISDSDNIRMHLALRYKIQYCKDICSPYIISRSSAAQSKYQVLLTRIRMVRHQNR